MKKYDYNIKVKVHRDRLKSLVDKLTALGYRTDSLLYGIYKVAQTTSSIIYLFIYRDGDVTWSDLLYTFDGSSSVEVSIDKFLERDLYEIY